MYTFDWLIYFQHFEQTSQDVIGRRSESSSGFLTFGIGVICAWFSAIGNFNFLYYAVNDMDQIWKNIWKADFCESKTRTIDTILDFHEG